MLKELALGGFAALLIVPPLWSWWAAREKARARAALIGPLTDAFVRHIGIVAERQGLVFGEKLAAGEPWSYEVGSGRLTVGERTYSAQVLGYHDEMVGKWRWAWHTTEDTSAHRLPQAARKLQRVGEHQSLDWLTTP